MPASSVHRGTGAGRIVPRAIVKGASQWCRTAEGGAIIACWRISWIGHPVDGTLRTHWPHRLPDVIR